MEKKKVAINGFGRIGRLAFRRLFNDNEVEVVAINCSHPTEEIAHLLKYDSTQGRFEYADQVKAFKDYLQVGKQKVQILRERDASKLPWKELKVDIVVECTGANNSADKSMAHINAGAKKVIISAPAGDVPTIVFGVNEKTLKKSDKIISGASCTTNCLAPMAYNLNNLAPIEKGLMTTIHAYTGDQEPLDAFHKKGDLRRARAAAVNIVPNTTGAAKAIGLVIPELKGKLDGAAQRVPTPTGSLTELTCVVNAKVTADEINAYMKKHKNDSYFYNEEPIVSSDIIGMSAGSMFDATQTKVMDLGKKSFVKVVAWYDNEYSYTCQLCRTVKYVAKKFI